MQASELRRGMFMRIQGKIHEVLETIHTSPGNLRAFIQLKTRELLGGKLYNNKLGVSESVEQVYMESHSVQYMYKDSEGYHFMNMVDYHTYTISPELVGTAANYLYDNMELKAWFNEEQPLKLELPSHVILTVAETEPGVKGDSISNSMKSATMDTGVRIQVPLFINVGDRLRINTTEGTYISRE